MRRRIDHSTRMLLPDDEVESVRQVVSALRASLEERPTRYVELSARTNFSFLRGASRPEDMVRKAKNLGYDALAITDTDGMYGMVRAWLEAKKVGLRLIIGCELTVEDGSIVTVYVENSVGYTNLCKILTLSHGRHKKGEAGIPLADLCAHAEGLWALVFPPYEGAQAIAAAFGARASMAIHLHKDGRDRARFAQAEDAARTVGLSLCATGRVLFAEPADKPVLDVLHCIREGTTLDAAGRDLLPNAEAHLRSDEEMVKLFGNHPAWIARSRTIADACRFSLSELRYDFPSHDPADPRHPDVRLAELTWAGAESRYAASGGVPESVRAQIEKELALIAKLDVAPYFLSVHEIIQMARRRDILCQGRGSAANSAVCFALGITAVDPARTNLLFERFLSAERHEPPDIDVDFEHERREEVIQDIYAKYGRDKAAMVSEVICYRGKSALREVGKVFGFSLEQIDRLSNLVSYWDSVGSVSEKRLREHGFDPDDGRVQNTLALSKRIQGFPRHLSIHVGGFVLSARPLTEVAPVEPATMPGRTVIPWDKDDMDALRFFKVDVLGLGMLTAIRKAMDAIVGGNPEKLSAIDRLARIPAEDPAVYDALCKADTVGVFQIESRAQMAMLPRLRPRKFYDLVVQVAIVRPGPIQGGMVHPYLRRRNGEEAVDPPHRILQPILERTLGVPLFQEQVMQIAIVGAGYTGGEADQLRRDMAAWRKNGNLARHKDRLRQGFRERGISEAFSERLYTQIQGFGEYGFPESHAASFALLVYASSWLKLHEPAAFAAALVNSQPMGFYSPSTLLQDAQRHRVTVKPIAIEASRWDLHLEDATTIRLGFRLVKGLGEEAAQRIEQARSRAPFASLEDLATRAALNRGELSALAEAGAISSLAGAGGGGGEGREPANRRQAIWRAHAPREDSGLFRGLTLDSAVPQLREPSRAEQLVLDYARTGVSVDDHPMKIARPQLGARVKCAKDLLMAPKGTRVEVAGMVICRQRPATASGVVFMTLEDETGFVNLVLWARTFEALHRVATTASLVRVKGKVDRSDNPVTNARSDPMPTATVHVIVESMVPLSTSPDTPRRRRRVGATDEAKTVEVEGEIGHALPSMSRDFH